MHWVRFAVLVVVACVLQAGMVDVLAVTTSNIKPDLLLILLVFFAIYSNTKDAIITSFTIGFAADIISTTAMGPKMLSFGLIGIVLAHLTRFIAIRKMPQQCLAIFLVVILAGLFTNLLNSLKDLQTASDMYITIFGISIYSAIIGPFLFLPSAWWMRIKARQFSLH